MEENKYIILTKEDGTEEKVEVLALFDLEETSKNYIIYTNGDTDGDLAIVNAAILVKNDAGYSLEKIEDDSEWSKVKDKMREIIKSNEE